jgi:hypothetical protein
MNERDEKIAHRVIDIIKSALDELEEISVRNDDIWTEEIQELKEAFDSMKDDTWKFDLPN